MVDAMPDKAFFAMAKCADNDQLARVLKTSSPEMLCAAAMRFKMQCDENNQVIASLQEQMKALKRLFQQAQDDAAKTQKRLDEMDHNFTMLQTDYKEIMDENTFLQDQADKKLFELEKLRNSGRVMDNNLTTGSPTRKRTKKNNPEAQPRVATNDAEMATLDPDDVPTPMPVANVPTTNRFSPIANDNLAVPGPSSAPMPSNVTDTQRTDATGPKESNAHRRIPVPPISISDFGSWTTLQKDIKAITTEKFRAKAHGKDMKIIPSTVDDYRAIARYLETKNINHVAFELDKEKVIRIVLKRVCEDIDLEAIKAELEDKGLSIKNILRLPKSKENTGCALILVVLPFTEANKRIYDVTEIAGLSIMAAKYERRSRTYQCYNCQRYGHGSASCHMPPRCVKCGKGHPTRECLRTRDQKATCANCSGPHPSNYRNCPAAPKDAFSTPFAPPSSAASISFNPPQMPDHSTPSNPKMPQKKLYSQVAASSSVPDTNQMMSAFSQMMSTMSANQNILMEAMKTLMMKLK